MSSDLDDEIAHLDTLGPHLVSGCIDRRGAGRARHMSCSLATGPDLRPAFFQNLPDHRQILRADFGIRGGRGQRGCRLSQRGTILEAPGGLEVIRIVGGLALVEIDDPLDGVFVAIGLHQHRIGREIDSHRA